MARTTWNPHSTDLQGLEFSGVGAIGHPIYSRENWRALRFRAQRTGEVDQISLYSGPLTVNPVLSNPHFRGHRAPYIVELYDLADFVFAASHTITAYTSTMTASAFVRDETNSTPEGNELAAANDDLFLIQSGNGLATATVHMPGASAFPLDRWVLSIAVEHNFLRQMRVRRNDQSNGSVFWERVLPTGNTNWHMGEAYIESADPAAWRLWTPNDVRQFANTVGTRRLIVTSLNKNQAQIIDLLRIHVDHLPEQRVGVGVFEPSTTDGWITVPLHSPGATGTPAAVVSGNDYVLLIRTPYGNTDYQTLTRLDLRAIPDVRTPDGSFSHFDALDWDLHAVATSTGGTIQGLDDLVNGLPAIRIQNNGSTTVDSQPYERTVGARVGAGQNATQTNMSRPGAAIEYGQIQFIASTDLNPTEHLTVTVETVGSFDVDVDTVAAAPAVGVDEYGHTYRQVTVPFGAGFTIGANPFDVTFSSMASTGAPWLISTLVASSSTDNPISQTFEDGTSFASGTIRDPRDNAIKTIASYGEGDMQIVLVSQPSELTGLIVTLQNQPVTGGVCEPCGPEDPLGCTVLSIPYPQICWNHSELNLDEFVHYELQRSENGGPYTTVAVLGTDLATETSGPVADSGIPNCWDDWSLPYQVPVSYQVRQRRIDGADSDWSPAVVTTVEMAPGADLVITNPDHPELNVAFPESYTARQPSREWEPLDSDQITYRAMYNRDGLVAFRPTERLGVRFRRMILVAALCTTITEPSLSVAQALNDLVASTGNHLVVRDRNRNRFYAAVKVNNLVETVDEYLGVIWRGDLEVTELSTPVVDVSSGDGGGHHA